MYKDYEKWNEKTIIFPHRKRFVTDLNMITTLINGIDNVEAKHRTEVYWWVEIRGRKYKCPEMVYTARGLTTFWQKMMKIAFSLCDKSVVFVPPFGKLISLYFRLLQTIFASFRKICGRTRDKHLQFTGLNKDDSKLNATSSIYFFEIDI